jgi:hypothetical protein
MMPSRRSCGASASKTSAKSRKVRRVDSEMVDENGDPEWLRRIRELHPEREDDTQANMTVSAVKIPSDDEWTEEETAGAATARNRTVRNAPG